MSPALRRITPACPLSAATACYTYDLVNVANPSVVVPDGATGSDTENSYKFITAGGTLPGDVVLGQAAVGEGPTTNAFSISVTDGLYVVRVRSINPLNPAGVASPWSAIIGTGEEA